MASTSGLLFRRNNHPAYQLLLSGGSERSSLDLNPLILGHGKIQGLFFFTEKDPVSRFTIFIFPALMVHQFPASVLQNPVLNSPDAAAPMCFVDVPGRFTRAQFYAGCASVRPAVKCENSMKGDSS